MEILSLFAALFESKDYCTRVPPPPSGIRKAPIQAASLAKTLSIPVPFTDF